LPSKVLHQEEVTKESIVEDMIAGVDESTPDHIKVSLKKMLDKYSGVFSKGQ